MNVNKLNDEEFINLYKLTQYFSFKRLQKYLFHKSTEKSDKFLLLIDEIDESHVTFLMNLISIETSESYFKILKSNFLSTRLKLSFYRDSFNINEEELIKYMKIENLAIMFHESNQFYENIKKIFKKYSKKI